jgi:hypothetical protein
MEKKSWICAALFLVSGCLCATQVSGQAIQVVKPAPEFSAEQILNGKMPGRKASPPPQPYSFDSTGFAANRLFHVPQAGVHPRVLFSAADLPGIRERLRNTQAGRQMLGYVRAQLAAGIDKPGTWENTLYRRLEAGDIEGFAQLYREPNYDTDEAVVPGNAIHIRKDAHPATSWHHREPFSVELELKAFVALLDDDAEMGRSVGKVIAGYGQYFEPRIDRAAQGRYGDSFWRAIRPVVDEHPFLAMAYDWDYNFMTEAERTQTRRVLAKITRGKYTLGMDLPAHWRNWNYMGLSMYFCLYALAIEGEEGYDPRIYQRSREVVRDYLAYAINSSGMAHEAVGYHTGGLGHLTELMIAMANRGDNFFTQTHYRAQLDQWLVHTMQPYGGEWFSDGDLGNFPPQLEPVMVAKFFYPDDANIDYVFRNLPDVKAGNLAHDYFMDEILITASDPSAVNPVAQTGDIGKTLHLSDTYADEARGVVITRSDWSKDALYLNFSCHPDTTFPSHDHADRGRFVLSGLGRNWAWQDSRPHDTGDTNSILIDGVGQGYFATPAKWLGMQTSEAGSMASCDVKYPYDWRWLKPLTLWAADDSRFDTPFYRWARKGALAADRSHAELDPSPVVRAYYDGYQAGNPMMWDEDSWVVRQPNNPVLYAFRSAGLVRGPHPYAVIVDDLRKDDATHRYSWIMQLEPDLELRSQHVEKGVRDIVVAEKNGNRRLLLRVLTDGEPAGDAYTENYSATVALRSLIPFAQGVYRLVIPVQDSALRMRVLLYPYREGEQLPASSWSPDHRRLSVEWPEQKDSIFFTVDGAERTGLTVLRNGKQILSSKR